LVQDVKYRTIVADPPWDVKAGTLRGTGFAGDWKLHPPSNPSLDLAYPSMTIDAISELPVADMADDDAHLYLWTINRYLDEAFDVERAWGFNYSTTLVWAKTPFGGGLGGAWGIATEYVLFCRRGSLRATGRVGRNWWDWKRPYDERGKPRHSGKPDAFQDLVEQVSPGPYLELFARRQRLGWDTWGNEALNHVEMPAA
jgi:N6-adenosine-specific RNA methylase IME4